MLLREFWTNRFWPYCTRNLRESTWVGYESAWRLHVMPVFGGMDMSAISVELVDKWLACFDSAGAARKAWAVLRAILRRAIRWNLLDVDITRRDIQLPAKPHYEPRILSIRQQRTLLRGFYGHLLEAWLICAVSCGLRTEEGYGLEWGDLDLRRGVLHVERGLQWVAGHEAVVPPKTELSRRTLPLPRFAVKRLRELRPREGGRLIGTLTPPQAARQYKAYCKRHDLPHVPRTQPAPLMGDEHSGGGSGYRHRVENARPQRYQNHREVLPQTGYHGFARRATPLGASPNSLSGFP